MNAPPKIFDRRITVRHRAQAANLRGAPHWLETANRGQLLDRLLDVTRSFNSGLSMGCRSGETAKALTQDHGIANVVACDLSEDFARLAYASGVSALACDEEWIPFGSNAFDLIIAEQCLHWTNDLPGSLIQLKRCLQPDGLFLASLFGSQTLIELRDAFMEAESSLLGGVTPRVSPFVDVRDAGNLLLRADFALPVADTDVITEEYDSLADLCSDLRQMGETNAIADRFKGLTTPRLFAATEEIYRNRHSTESGTLRATFEIITLTAWAPADTQQQPLARGSAKTRLSDALGSQETSLDID